MIKLKNFTFLMTIILMTILIVGCGNSIKNTIIGEWANCNDESRVMKFYEDGTCEIPGEYGTCTYTIESDNLLKITNYYGEIQTFEYVEFNELDNVNSLCWCIKDDKLYIGSSDNYYIKK